MGKRIGLVLGVTLAASFGAADAFAAVVYQRCSESCNPVFVADKGRSSQVRVTAVRPYEYPPPFSDRFEDPAARYITGVSSSQLGSLQTTLARCDFERSSATCEYDDLSYVYLGDMDDEATVVGRTFPSIHGEAGSDTVRLEGVPRGVGWSVAFTGGTGADELIGSGVVWYPPEPGVNVAMRIDLDGVADDGRPGEGDNVHPGQAVRAYLAGDHVLVGSDEPETLNAGEGDQSLEGRGGGDYLASGEGNDTLDGGDGDELMQGGLGDDVNYAGAGDDRIGDSGGDDFIDAGAGVDQAESGPGNDTIDLRDGAADRWISCGDGVDTIYVDAVDPEALNCENVIFG